MYSFQFPFFKYQLIVQNMTSAWVHYFPYSVPSDKWDTQMTEEWPPLEEHIGYYEVGPLLLSFPWMFRVIKVLFKVIKLVCSRSRPVNKLTGSIHTIAINYFISYYSCQESKSFVFADLKVPRAVLPFTLTCTSGGLL